MADVVEGKTKLVYAITACREVPVDSEVHIFLDKKADHKTSKGDKEEDGTLSWLPEAFVSVIPDASPPKEVSFRVGSFGFLKKKVHGQVKFEIDELPDSIPIAKWYPLRSTKGDKEVKGEIHIQLIKITTKVTWSVRDFSRPVHALLRNGLVEQAKNLLNQKDNGVNVDEKDEHDMTALHFAVVHDHDSMIPLLVKAGMKVNATMSDSRHKPHKDMRDIQVKNFTPLHLAALHGSGKITSLLLQEGANLEALAGSYNVTPLHVAAAFNHVGPVKELLAKGAKVNAQDEMGDTPLHIAMQKGSNEVIKPLVLGGADMKLKNNSDKSVSSYIGTSEVSLSSQIAVIEATGAEDHREFLLRLQNPNLKATHLAGVIKEKWTDCPQFGLLTQEDEASVYVMIHQAHDHTKDNQMQRIGFVVVGSTPSQYILPSWKVNLIDYGKSDAYKCTLRKNEQVNICPYSKLPEACGPVTLIVLSESPVEVKQLKQWKFELSLPGEWNEQTSGGSIQFEKDWTRNPMYVVTMPEGKETIDFRVHLEQAQEAADMTPFSVHPYQIFIGFYMFDMTLQEQLYGTSTFLNSQSVYDTMTVDTTKRNKFIIVPATHEPGQCTRFTLHISSDAEFRVAPVKKTYQE